MALPDHVAARYESAVKGAARDVYKAYGHIYGKSALIAEAWGITAGRWETWEGKDNPSAASRVDIRLRLYSWCQGNARAMGFERIATAEGKNVYRQAEMLAYRSDFFVRTVVESTIGIPGQMYSEDEVDLDQPWRRYSRTRLPMDWPDMTVRQVFKFAEILFRDYIDLCADFYRLEIEARPAKRSVERWTQTREIKRANLRIKWGRELDAARYEAFFGRKPPRELAT